MPRYTPLSGFCDQEVTLAMADVLSKPYSRIAPEQRLFNELHATLMVASNVQGLYTAEENGEFGILVTLNPGSPPHWFYFWVDDEEGLMITVEGGPAQATLDRLKTLVKRFYLVLK